MNVLFQDFPQTVTVCDKEYRIVTDFREWIKLSELLNKTEKLTVQLLKIILEWYIDKPPENTVEAIRALQDFLSAEDIYPPVSGVSLPEPGKAVFSFEQDAICIYCAFYAVYGIDICKIQYMHWWEFRVLFEGLPSDTEIKERIYYRGVNLNDIKDKEERRRIKEIKKRIALPERHTRLTDYQIGEMFM